MITSSLQPASLDPKKKNPPTRILLGPGPSLVDPRVLGAMVLPLVGHLDPWFVQFMDQNQELLRYVFQTTNRLTIPISGTGSAAMEAAVANMVEPGDNVLVCINGYFGTRLADMVGRYGGNLREIHKPWGEVFSPDEIQQALSEFPAKAVCIVHAETSTGALQPLEKIPAIVHAQGGVLIVDAVTSLGGVPLLVDDWDIDVCYSGTQKCLSCPPSLGPITLGPRAVEKLLARRTKVPNWYLDLTMIQKYWGSERTYHHTAPITANYALHAALEIVVEEGLDRRWQRHHQNARLLWAGVEALGLELHVDEAHRLPSLTTIRVPDGVDEMQVRKRLLEEFNIEIAGGLGELKGKIWRVGLMGYGSRPENVVLFLEALRRALD